MMNFVTKSVENNQLTNCKILKEKRKRERRRGSKKRKERGRMRGRKKTILLTSYQILKLMN